jgi:hypothetical protein
MRREYQEHGEEFLPRVYVVSRAISPEYSIALIPKPWNPYIFITESKREIVAVRR